MEKILVTGALGQLGTELASELQHIHGTENVIITDIHPPLSKDIEGRFMELDVLDRESIKKIIRENQITQIYHLAAILSANAEKSPALAWKINMDGLINILEKSNPEVMMK